MISERQMTLATDYQRGFDPTGWLASEKLDGIRAFWGGSKFWTRGGNVINAPAWLAAGLPSVALDGEIWAGRGGFEEARQAVQLGRWMPAIRFTVFDCPNIPGAWTVRLRAAARLWRDVVESEAVQGHGWLMDRLKAVQDGGGEGLMIRHPRIKGYEMGRTGNLLKVKSWMPD